MSLELHVASLMLTCIALGVVGDEMVRMVVKWRRRR